MKIMNKKYLGVISKLAVAPLVFCVIAQSAFADSSVKPIDNSFSYKVVGEVNSDNLHCDIGTDVETVSATLEDLDKITHSKFLGKVIVYAVKKGVMMESMDITGNGKSFEVLRNLYPSMTITGVVKHTNVKSCQIIDVAKSKAAPAGKQVKVIYETAFSGYVGIKSLYIRPHHYLGFRIESILNDIDVDTRIETTFIKDI
jgi:hypothetical protein